VTAALALGLLLFVILQCNKTEYREPPPRLPIAKSLQDIHDRKILFNPPREMDQGKSERVEARISYQDIGDAITKELKGRGDPQVDTIKVGQKMTVTLHADENDFNIKKYSSDEQLVEGRQYAQWEWDVTPLEPGDLTIHLKAVINVADPKGQEAAYDIPVMDRPIRVKVNPAYIAVRAAHNEKIWNALFGSGFGLFVISNFFLLIRDVLKLRREKREKRQKEEEQKPKNWETP